MLRPLDDRIVVKVSQKDEKSMGGIVLPDTAKEKPQEGEVISIGPGRVLENGTRLALSVKVGDKVIFAKYGGSEVKIDGVEYLIMRETDVLAIRG